MSQSKGIARMVLRAGLVVLATFLLWTGYQIQGRAYIQRSVTYELGWASWLKWNGVSVLAGLAIGLAMLLPRSVRYRPSRVILLAALPIVWLADSALLFGPNSAVKFGQQHLRFLLRWPASIDKFGFEPVMAIVAAVWLGLAIAAGFEQGQ